MQDVREYNHIRNMLGFTGTYKGVRVSVQGSGMGMPSMAIYATELVKDYGVNKIIRTGTCGALQPDIQIRDIVIGQAATTDSSMARNVFGPGINYAPTADFALVERAVTKARELNIPVHVGNILSQDCLYDEKIDLKRLSLYGVLAAEMEAAALYLIGARYHIQTVAICTVSNHILTGEDTTAEERETSFDDMAKIALETAILD